MRSSADYCTSPADRAERQPVPVNDLLAETLRLLEAQAAAHSVSLEQDLELDLPAILGSASALRQVFLKRALPGTVTSRSRASPTCAPQPG